MEEDRESYRRAAERRDKQRELLSALRRQRKLEAKIERLKERLRELSYEEEEAGNSFAEGMRAEDDYGIGGEG